MDRSWEARGSKNSPSYFLLTFPFKASKQGLVNTASTKLEPAELNYLPSPLENLPTALEPLVAFISLIFLSFAVMDTTQTVDHVGPCFLPLYGEWETTAMNI